jgi:hypothetical protein
MTIYKLATEKCVADGIDDYQLSLLLETLPRGTYELTDTNGKRIKLLRVK